MRAAAAATTSLDAAATLLSIALELFTPFTQKLYTIESNKRRRMATAAGGLQPQGPTRPACHLPQVMPLNPIVSARRSTMHIALAVCVMLRPGRVQQMRVADILVLLRILEIMILGAQGLHHSSHVARIQLQQSQALLHQSSRGPSVKGHGRG